jgi:hypothetical protein
MKNKLTSQTVCTVCAAPTQYEAQDYPLCHRCAVLVLEYVSGPEFWPALDAAQDYMRNLVSTNER